ncbi:hypothetical protein DNU06_12465 [Putridiphycobacter roseus]|uniref:Uncharacterized protein n=2 Tax=Putridiphycobacter roseus TaxID=2219161 RepID=A0A2W1N166_9FLAO|nr:hypothetical protein DNU06_12465 [Putridiphycobacter roseus]
MVLLGAIHFLIAKYLLPDIYFNYRIIFIYLFLLPLSLLGTLAIFYIHKTDDSLIGKGFLAFTVIKILGSFVFLLPFLMDQDDFTKPFVYQFFAVFFPSLIVETFVILRMVNIVEAEKTTQVENP